MGKRSQKSKRHKRIARKNSDDPDDDESKVIEPWKEAGYESFAAYNTAVMGKITETTSAVETLTQTTQKQAATIAELQKKPATTEQTAEEKAAAEKLANEEQEPTDDEKFKKKATKLFASLTPEEQKQAEDSIAKLPDEIRAIAAGSYEGKYALLKSMKPDAEVVAEDSFFSDLIPTAEKKTVSEQLMDALSNLNGKKNNMSPERKGSGFVPRQEGDDQQGNKSKAARPKLNSLFS